MKALSLIILIRRFAALALAFFGVLTLYGEESIEAELKALEVEGESLARLESIGKAYQAQGDYPNAIKYFQMAAVREDATVETISDLVDLYLLLGQGDISVGLLKSAVKKFPDSAKLLSQLGRSYAAQEKYPLAVYTYQKAMKLDPADQEIRYRAADALHLQGKFELAESTLEPVMKASDRSVDAVLLYARILFDSDRQRQGIRLLGKLYESDKPNERVRTALVEMLLENSMIESEAGRFSRAVEYLEQADTITPNEISIGMGLVLFNNELGKTNVSIQYCQKLIESHPENLRLYVTLGRLQRAEGRGSQAEETFGKGLDIAKRLGDSDYIQQFENLLNPLE